jgi:hypothetical protein
MSSFAGAAAVHQLQVVTATFWTVAPALDCRAALTVHLCQGSRGNARKAHCARIDAAYRHPIPKLTVGSGWMRLRRHYGAEIFHRLCRSRGYPASSFLGVAAMVARVEGGRRVKVPLFESSVKESGCASGCRSAVTKAGHCISRGFPACCKMSGGAITAVDDTSGCFAARMAQHHQADMVRRPPRRGRFGLPFAEGGQRDGGRGDGGPSYLSLIAS